MYAHDMSNICRNGPAALWQLLAWIESNTKGIHSYYVFSSKAVTQM